MKRSPSRALRVLVDGTHLTADAKGVGLYTKNVLELLPALDPALDLSVLVLAGNPPPAAPSDAVDRRPIAWRNHFWHGFRTLPRCVRELAPDVVWMPYEAPLARLPVPYLMVCHDVPGELRRAQELGGERRGLRERLRDGLDDRLIRRTLGGAFRVFSNSRYVADHLVSDLAIAKDRIRLAPCAPGADFAGLSRRVDVPAVRARLGLEEGYVLTFSTGDARENPAIVPAVYQALADSGTAPGLVVAGVRPADRQRVEARFAERPWRDRVRFVPFLGAAELFELVEVYTAATVYLDPSLQEGFGMQVVEAMACGTPVVASDRGALPEVTAGAALLADPQDAPALAAQVREVLDDPAKRADLVRRGAERARSYSWRRTAEVIHRGLCAASGG